MTGVRSQNENREDQVFGIGIDAELFWQTGWFREQCRQGGFKLIRIPGFGRYRKATVGIGRLEKFMQRVFSLKCSVFRGEAIDRRLFQEAIREVAVGGG